LARKTRLRKKFLFESLQKQASQLASENEILKGIVKQRMAGEVQSQVLSVCSSKQPGVLATAKVSDCPPPTTLLKVDDYGLIAVIQAAQRSFVITDPSMPDNPIVFASHGFLELSGYSLSEVLGRNCRFMQGPKTDPRQVQALSRGIASGEDTSVCLLNYKKNGTMFYNQIFVAALRDEHKNISNYVGVQVEVRFYSFPTQPARTKF